jgi:20S proteasome alpha/beta subunit
VTATPNSGYAFVDWTVSGTVVSTSASYTFALTGNVTLVANFAAPQVIESKGVTWLTQVGNQYCLCNSSGVGPWVRLAGSAVVAGQFGAGVVPIGAEQTASGYEIAWKVTGADQYVVWNLDSNGNYVSAVTGLVSGASFAVEALEPSFHQDLNGDGVMGPPGMTVIETAGSTWLTQVGNQYYFYNSSGSGPVLKLAGSAVVAGQFGAGVVPIGAEQTASGYEVTLMVTGANQYVVWSTDSNGNYVSSITNLVSGTSFALEALEPSFHQDLNSDGVMGPPGMTVIETAGITWLTQIGNQYYLYNTSGSGPVLKLAGAPVVTGQFGAGVVLIGAEQTASGYEVALMVTGANEYVVWNTDSNGNYVSAATGLVSGQSAALIALETSFQQDLNGNGVIGQ